MSNSTLLHLHDVTLRDGNHAIKHQLTKEQIYSYCQSADKAGVQSLEVGHGNGLGASSLQIGFAKESDETMLKAARSAMKQTQLTAFMLPGFSTVQKDLAPAIELGLDHVRVGCHCTESDLCLNHIKYALSKNIPVTACLMMSHMLAKDGLLAQAKLLQDAGVQAVSLFDSAGNYLPDDVTTKVTHLVDNLAIDIGFHAHNNLGVGIANSIAAVKVGAKLIDGAILGFGAGCGNAQLEVLVAVYEKMGYQTGIDLYGILDCASLALDEFIEEVPTIKPIGLVSGLAGVFSGFSKHVDRVAQQYDVDPRDIFFELGRRSVIAGQEDLIIDVASQLKNECNEKT